MIDRMTEKTIRLLLEQKEPITTSVIANEIGVSRSSIKHNLDYVKKTLQKAGVLLNSIPGKLYDTAVCRGTECGTQRYYKGFGGAGAVAVKI